MNTIVKNINPTEVLSLSGLVEYADGQVVSRTLAQNKSLSLTYFAFDQGEEISAHASSGDALVYVLDGSSQVTIGDEVFTVNAGETILMPAGVPHALYAIERFKMQLVVVFPPAPVVNF